VVSAVLGEGTGVLLARVLGGQGGLARGGVSQGVAGGGAMVLAILGKQTGVLLARVLHRVVQRECRRGCRRGDRRGRHCCRRGVRGGRRRLERGRATALAPAPVSVTVGGAGVPLHALLQCMPEAEALDVIGVPRQCRQAPRLMSNAREQPLMAAAGAGRGGLPASSRASSARSAAIVAALLVLEVGGMASAGAAVGGGGLGGTVASAAAAVAVGPSAAANIEHVESCGGEVPWSRPRDWPRCP